MEKYVATSMLKKKLLEKPKAFLKLNDYFLKILAHVDTDIKSWRSTENPNLPDYVSFKQLLIKMISCMSSYHEWKLDWLF